MKRTSVTSLLSALIRYAQREMYLSPLDAIYAENQLLSLFKQTEPEEAPKKNLALQEEILDPLMAYAVENGLCAEHEKILFETKVMGLVTPAPGVVQSIFENIAATENVQKATDYLMRISEKSNYIRRVDVNKNLCWTAPGSLGNLTITVNLSKPEKTAEQVAREKAMPQTNYPKCMLCVENVGFHGTAKHPARQTLRVIPVFMNNEQWYVQYSPYVYYENHCIAFAGQHKPMAINSETFVKLFDFIDLFPHFFIGSNADLPIVGGSILAHDHFQGGKKVLPMFTRNLRTQFSSKAFPDVECGILDWYNSVVLLKGKNRKSLEEAANRILSAWREYSDATIDVLAYTDQPHNTITPIAEQREDGYRLYLILRNNRTTAERPDGLFHPAPEMHNIKKEGIGLIEAMGLFILPGRLERESKAIVEILSAKENPDFSALSKEDHPLSKHLGMIMQLSCTHGVGMPVETAQQAVVDYINDTCIKILECTGVFKNTTEGQNAFAAFLTACGFERV